jgi:hypothetical protein
MAGVVNVEEKGAAQEAAGPAGENPASVIAQCNAVVMPDAQGGDELGESFGVNVLAAVGHAEYLQVESVQRASKSMGCVIELRDNATQSRGWNNWKAPSPSFSGEGCYRWGRTG